MKTIVYAVADDVAVGGSVHAFVEIAKILSGIMNGVAFLINRMEIVVHYFIGKLGVFEKNVRRKVLGEKMKTRGYRNTQLLCDFYRLFPQREREHDMHYVRAFHCGKHGFVVSLCQRNAVTLDVAVKHAERARGNDEIALQVLFGFIRTKHSYFMPGFFEIAYKVHGGNRGAVVFLAQYVTYYRYFQLYSPLYRYYNRNSSVFLPFPP